MIKLAFIITGLDTGGAEMMLLKLLERLSRRFSAQVISLTNIGPIGRRIQALDFPVIALGMNRKIPNPGAILKLVKILRHHQPDVAHTWMYHADLLGGLAARIARVPTVVWGIQHSDFDRKKSKIATRLVVALCAWLSSTIPDRIQCCSAVAKDIHVSLGYPKDRFVIIPNGFDLRQFQPSSNCRESVHRELRIAADAPIVGLFARFNPQKNHMGFFDAVGRVHQQRPDVHFLLAGKRIDTSNSILMAAIRQAKVEDVVHLLGLREDIPRLMAALDIFVSAASFGEGFPNVLGEAMSCGVPCVATNVGDSAYIVGKTGRITAPNDTRGMADALYLLLNRSPSDRRAMGQQARQRIEENFEIGHIVGLYESLYQEAHSAKRNMLANR